MSILFRYIFREFGKIFLMCFSGLMTIYLVIDFFEKVRRFLRYDADWLDVLTYFLLKVPAISFHIAPLWSALPRPRNYGHAQLRHQFTPNYRPFYGLCRGDLPCALTLQFHRHSVGGKQI